MKALLFVLFCFFFGIITKEPFLHFQGPIKPFISVLSPDSLNQFDQVQNKNSQKFLEKKNHHNSLDALPESVEPYIFKEDPVTESWDNISFAAKCMVVDDYNLYDISSASHKDFYTEKIYFEKEDINGNITEGETAVMFNLCYDVKSPDNSYKDNQIFVNNGTNYVPITNPIGKGNRWNFHKIGNQSEIFIKVNSNKNYEVYYKLICKKSVDYHYVNESSFYYQSYNGTSKMIITIETDEACSQLDFYAIWKFVNDYQGVFATLLGLLGLFLCLAGQKYSKLTSFLLTVFVVAFLVIFYSQFILPAGCAEWKIWIVLTFAIILGVVAGYFVFKYHDKVFALLVGGFAGFFLGEFCYDLFGSEIDANQTLIHILFIFVSIIVSVAVAYFARDFIIIIATSFIGAYAFIRAISIFAGGFPSEFTVMDLKDNDEDDQLDDLITWKVYVYLVFIVIICGLGIFVQIKLKRKDKEKQKEKHENHDQNLD